MSGPGTVLVLGASGFLGRRIAEELGSSGIEVLAPERAEGADLLDPKGLLGLISRSRPDAVVNAAGMTSPARAMQDPAACFSLNTGGVLNLLEAIRAGSPSTTLVALSSAAVYSGEPPFREGSETAPSTPYAASKLAMELLCDQHARGEETGIAVLRCFNLTGPGEPATQASSEFALAAIEAGPGGSTEVAVGEPATARDFTDVRDAARAVRLLLERGATGTYNLCSGKATSLSELARTIGELTGADVKLRGSGTGKPASGLLEVRGSGEKLKAATGWRPEIALETSLGDLISDIRIRNRPGSLE